ncbi:MAG TPA: hypothetical protein VJ508_05405, partial [Saprospiraceae bacterium]|nr:hypothetical protein [Saprospiraceae bacterium]
FGASLIRLELEDNGGGQLVLANDPGDNKIYLEAFNATGDGSAAELLRLFGNLRCRLLAGMLLIIKQIFHSPSGR